MDQTADDTFDSKRGCTVKKCVASVAKMEFRRSLSRILAAEYIDVSGCCSHREAHALIRSVIPSQYRNITLLQCCNNAAFLFDMIEDWP